MTTRIGIEEYLKVACQMMIDEFNEKYKYTESKEYFRTVANEELSQADICHSIGKIFQSYTSFRNNGVFVNENKFYIGVHYLKSYKGGSGNLSNRKPWGELKAQFDFIENEIRIGNKGKNIYIIGWFNCIDSFSQVVQLGQSTGNNPYVNDNRMIYFPFIKKTSIPARTLDLDYKYLESYNKLNISLIGDKDDIDFNCMFIGSKEDKFHFAIYY